MESKRFDANQLSTVDEVRQFESPRVPYESPELTEYGSLAELTQSGGISTSDGGGITFSGGTF